MPFSRVSKNHETRFLDVCLGHMKNSMRAMVFLLAAISAPAMTGCEMDLEEMDEEELAGIEEYEALEALEVDSVAAAEGQAPAMGPSALLRAVRCNEVFAFVGQGPPPGHFRHMAYAYQDSSSRSGGLRIVQGTLEVVPFSTTRIRGQGGQAQNLGFSGADGVRIDLNKNFILGNLQLASSIRMQLADGPRYLLNKVLSPRVCQQFQGHATVFADAADGSQLTLYYSNTSFGG